MSKPHRCKSTPKGQHLAAFPPKWARYCWAESVRSEFRTEVRRRVFEMCDRTRVVIDATYEGMERAETPQEFLAARRRYWEEKGWVEPGFDPSGLVVEVMHVER